MKINNNQVNDIYNRWKSVYKNEDNELNSRLKAYSIINVIEALVHVYEYGDELFDEEIDDLFIAWGKEVKPVFPEDIRKIRKDLSEILNKEGDKL